MSNDAVARPINEDAGLVEIAYVMSQFPLGCRLDPRVQAELRHAPEAKWRRLILYFLAQGGPTRYGELRRAIRDVSDKMLIQQLKELEADGLVKRTDYKEVPPRVNRRS